MTKPPTNPGERLIKTHIDLNAPIEDVWRALTVAEELTNWFPLHAEIKPGEGGSIMVSWGEGGTHTTPIDKWQAPNHLRLVYVDPTPPDKLEEAREQGFIIPFQVAVDYYLEDLGNGQTRLRLVHSGFSEDAAWDNQYDGTVRGWAFELGGLKHYLEHHKGTKRRVIHAKAVLDPLSLDEAWNRLMSSDGLVAEGSIDGLKPSDSYDFTTVTGEELTGTVQIINPPQDFCGTDDQHNNAYLRVRIDEACFTQAQREANLWLSTFGVSEDECAAIERRWNEMLSSLFAQDPVLTQD